MIASVQRGTELAEAVGFDDSIRRRLQIALSPAAMVACMHRENERGKYKNLEYTDCRPVRVYPRGEKGFLIEYEMRPERGRGIWLPRFAELTQDDATKRYRVVRRRLLRLLSGSELGQQAVESGIGCVPELGMILRSPGLDERLHGLVLMHEPWRLASAISNGDSQDKVPPSMQAQLLGHRVGKRAIVRFCQTDLPTHPTTNTSFVAKTYKFRSDLASRVHTLMGQLWRDGFGADSPVSIPKPLGLVEGLQTFMMEDIQGICLGEITDPNGYHRGVKAAGNALSRIHHCSIEIPKRHGVDHERWLLHRWVQVVAAVHPHLSTSVLRAFSVVDANIERCRHAPMTLAHRDFYEKQILLKGSRVWLIDFDTACMADPALDVGNFFAHLELARLQQLLPITAPEKAFLEGYGRTLEATFASRVVAYTQSALLRLACLYSFRSDGSSLSESLLASITGGRFRDTCVGMNKPLANRSKPIRSA